MDGLTPNNRGPKEMIVGCAFGPGIAVEMCMLKRNLDHVKREWDGGVQSGVGGELTPPLTESEGTGSGNGSEGEVEVEDLKKVKEEGEKLDQKLKMVEPGVLEQNAKLGEGGKVNENEKLDSLEEALDGVELD